MANEGDRIRVQFTETEALAQQLLDRLAEDIAQATAIGDELEVARLQAKRSAIGGTQQYVRETPQIEQDTAAVNQENVARARGLEIELQTLEVLKQQLAERLALEEAIRGGRLIPPPAQAGAFLAGGTRFGMGHGGLAGQQVVAEEAAAAAQLRAEEAAITRELEQQQALRERAIAQMRDVGFAAGAGGQQVANRGITAGPMGAGAAAMGGAWTADEQGLARYNLALGEYEGFATRAGQTSNMLTADLTRLGIVQAEASNEMRAHGALTTEWLQSMARGETTVSEFGYQMGATIGKVAGWTAATTATFAALGMVVEFGKGAIDSANAVQQLRRTIDGLNTDKAAQDIRQLSQDTNVSIKEAGDTVFQFSRTFHNLDDAVGVSRLGLEAYHLDNVSIADSVKTATAIHVQYGYSLTQIASVYDMLAAGQREYNARISDMVPLLQRSSGAVRNAGGDLTELIQLATVGLRLMPGLGGAQLGTAFYRGAATQAAQHSGDLASRFGLGRDINPLTGQMNFTQLVMDAIRESAHMSQPQRRELAADLFGKQYGGRTAAFFGPEAAQLLDQVTGRRRGPEGPITPEATRGSMQQEFDRQLAQVQQRLHAFVYAIQDLGAALAQTGALVPLGAGLNAVIGTLHAVTGLINEFDKLPQPLREMISLFIELRLAMMFISRTRIGSSLVPQSWAGAVSRIPGMGATAETQLRGELAGGTRAALREIESQYAQVVAQATTTGARSAALERQRLAYVQQAGGEESLTAAQLEKSNAMSARVAALKEEQLKLEAQQAALEGERAALNEQMVGLTASRMSSSRYSRGQVMDVATAAGADTAALEGEAAMGTAARASQLARGAATGLVTRARAFLLGLDPLTVALIGLPLAYESISGALNAQSDALKEATRAANAPVSSASDLSNAASRLRDAARKQGKGPGGMFGDFIAAGEGYDYISQAAQTKGLAEQTGALGTLYSHAASLFQKDGAELVKTAAGRRELAQEASHLRQSMARALAQSDVSLPESLKVMHAFSQTLQGEYEQLAANSDVHGPNTFAVFAGLSPKTIQQHLQGLDDISKVFGTNNDALRTAALQYAAMVNDSRKWIGAGGKNPDDASLQALASSQQNFVNAVNKNVQDLIHQASSATTNQGEMGSINQAVALLNNERSQVQRSFAQAIAYAEKAHEGAAAVKLLQGAERQMMASLADLHKQVIDAAISQIQSEGDLATSEIQGISQLSDIQRAQSQADTYARELSYAKSHGADAQTLNDLQKKLNDQNLAVLKQRTDYGRSLLDSSGALAISQVTGIGPQADIQRAQLGISRASQILAYDQAHGADQATINQDMANLMDAQRTLNQQIQQRSQQIDQDAAGFIQATAAYQESRTTDPVRSATEQLKADIAVLATIRPQDYRTYQEYQTAVLQQRAKIGDEIKSRRQAIVDKDMQTLNFELHTQRITDQEYLAGLERLLKMKHLSLQQRQTIESALFDAMHQTAVNLNVGNIRMPTAYEVRAAIARAHAGGRDGRPPREGMMVQSNTTNHFNMTFNVDSRRDPHIRAVTDAITRALNQVQGQAQAAGVFG